MKYIMHRVWGARVNYAVGAELGGDLYNPTRCTGSSKYTVNDLVKEESRWNLSHSLQKKTFTYQQSKARRALKTTKTAWAKPAPCNSQQYATRLLLLLRLLLAGQSLQTPSKVLQFCRGFSIEPHSARKCSLHTPRFTILPPLPWREAQPNQTSYTHRARS